MQHIIERQQDKIRRLEHRVESLSFRAAPGSAHAAHPLPAPGRREPTATPAWLKVSQGRATSHGAPLRQEAGSPVPAVPRQRATVGSDPAAMGWQGETGALLREDVLLDLVLRLMVDEVVRSTREKAGEAKPVGPTGAQGGAEAPVTSAAIDSAIHGALSTMVRQAPGVVKAATVKGRQVEALVGEVIVDVLRDADVAQMLKACPSRPPLPTRIPVL